MTRKFVYAFANPQTGNFEQQHTRIETRVSNPASPVGYVKAIRYFDALGRERFAKVERTIGTASPAAAPATVIEGQVDFDREGRVVKQYAPYQAASAVASPMSAVTTLTYQLNATSLEDPLGRIHKVDPPDAQEVTSSYSGRFTSSIDASNAKVVTERDHLGRAVATENHDAGGFVIGTSFTLDGAGRVLTRVTSGDLVTEVSHVYDTLGRLIEKTDPDSGIWRYGYDPVGNLVYVDDPKASQHVQSVYDKLNRVVRRCTYATDAFDPTASETSCGTGAWESTFAYGQAFAGHGVGRLTTATDRHGSELFWYDARGRVEQQERTIRSATTETSFVHDKADRLKTITYPDGDAVDYGYNAAGQLISIEGVVSDIDYNFMGQSTAVVRSNGTTDIQAYYGSEQSFRLRDVQTVVSATPTIKHLDLTYAYNNIAKVSSVTDHRNPVGSPPNPLSNSAGYFYDPIGRLETVSGSSFDDAFDFDDRGNLSAKSGLTLAYSAATHPHQVASYGSTAVTYDANGNRKQKNEPGVEVESYTYNALDQVVQISVGSGLVVFDHDYAGRRLSRRTNSGARIRYFNRFAETQGATLTKHFWAGDLLVASSHEDASAATTPAPMVEIPIEGWLLFGSVAAVLLLGAGLPLLRTSPERVLAVRSVGAMLLVLSMGPPMLLLPQPARAGGGGGGGAPPYLGMRHYHVDRLGSTQVVTDDLGAILQQIRYDSYGAIRTRVDAAGAPLDGSESDDARRTFTGYEDEWLSGLQYAGVRFYDPELAQFLTHDPAAQFPSPYAYGPGDPMNGTDPSGALFGIDIAVLIAIGIVVGASTAFAVAQAYVFGGNPLKAGLTAAGMGLLGAGLGIAVGAAGAAVGTDSQVMGLLTNPLVQDSLIAASAGLPAASAAAGGDTSEALGILSAALSLSLAFAAGASSAASGSEAGSVKSQSAPYSGEDSGPQVISPDFKEGSRIPATAREQILKGAPDLGSAVDAARLRHATAAEVAEVKAKYGIEPGAFARKTDIFVAPGRGVSLGTK